MSAPPLHGSAFTRATKVIAVADVVESVRLMEQAEHAFIRRWHSFVNYVHEQAPMHSGRLHKSLGDGLMLEFAEAAGCIRAALAMQAWFRDVNQGLAPEEHVHLRIGAHVADFVADKYDIYGTDVNLAARIATLAGPGEVVISQALRDRLGRALPLHLVDLGPCHLKHVKQPVHAYRIGQAGAPPVLPAQEIGLRASVAVLPFPTDGAPVGGIAGETLADELVSALARSDALQVVSRMTAVPPDGEREASPAPQAPPRYLLAGRARAQAGGLALYAELADAANGHVVWADSFQPASPETGLLDSRLLAQVLAGVHGAVIQHEVQAAADRPFPALDGSALLLASLGLMHRLAPLDLEQARRMLDHLLERWRRHPMPHAWLAHLHILQVQQACAGFTRHEASLARAHATAAAQADPGSPLVLALDGYTYLHGTRNAEAASERYGQALSLRGQHSLALLFQAELLALRGATRQARDAAAQARDSLSLEPMRFIYDAIGALCALADGDAPAAAQLAQAALQRNPRYVPAWRTLVVAQVESERLGEARASQQQLLKRQPAFTVSGFIGSTPLREELEARFADALVQAGAPPR
jgi:class 3 adenylate cyclase/tetratricopeptide (TPR) repeat protein